MQYPFEGVRAPRVERVNVVREVMQGTVSILLAVGLFAYALPIVFA